MKAHIESGDMAVSCDEYGNIEIVNCNEGESINVPSTAAGWLMKSI